MKEEAIRFFEHEIPKELTKEDLKNEFIDSLWNLVEYWKNKEDPVEGIAFSFLSLIDGCQLNNIGYLIYPYSDMDSICYDMINGNDYRPLNPYCINDNTYLHDEFYSRKPK